MPCGNGRAELFRLFRWRHAGPGACITPLTRTAHSTSVIDSNAAWGSGIYGCDPMLILPVLRRACLRADQLIEADRAWIISREI